jgi:hypothetical protein
VNPLVAVASNSSISAVRRTFNEGHLVGLRVLIDPRPLDPVDLATQLGSLQSKL